METKLADAAARREEGLRAVLREHEREVSRRLEEAAGGGGKKKGGEEEVGGGGSSSIDRAIDRNNTAFVTCLVSERESNLREDIRAAVEAVGRRCDGLAQELSRAVVDKGEVRSLRLRVDEWSPRRARFDEGTTRRIDVLSDRLDTALAAVGGGDGGGGGGGGSAATAVAATAAPVLDDLTLRMAFLERVIRSVQDQVAGLTEASRLMLAPPP
eukprot:Rhum_TRINITY_DN1104_c0_g1::Rhum_TRINITY_DN1104_c0_g1_i1::g.3327::m.3327